MKRMGIVVVVAALLLGCRGSQEEAPAGPQPAQWRVKGKIVSVNAAEKRVTLDHQNIPGLMAAMTMTFPVAEAQLLEGLAEGDAVEFTLTQTSSGLTITQMRKIDPALLEQSSGPKIYHGRGRVKLVNPEAAAVLLEHEAIPDVMPAGELALAVRPPSLLAGIEDGTPVEFTLTDSAEGLVITELKKLPKK